MNFSIRQAPNGVWYGSFPEFDRMGIKHGFATRLGGLSEGPYKSLNLVFRARDKVENVIGNRQKFCEAIGVDFTKAVGGHQVHGDKVAGAWPLTIRVGLAALAIVTYLAFTHRPYQRRQV